MLNGNKVYSKKDIIRAVKNYDMSPEIRDVIYCFVSELTGLSPRRISEEVRNLREADNVSKELIAEAYDRGIIILDNYPWGNLGVVVRVKGTEDWFCFGDEATHIVTPERYKEETTREEIIDKIYKTFIDMITVAPELFQNYLCSIEKNIKEER